MKQLIKIGETILIGAITTCFIALIIYIITSTDAIRYTIAGVIGLGILYAIGIIVIEVWGGFKDYRFKRRHR